MQRNLSSTITTVTLCCLLLALSACFKEKLLNPPGSRGASQTFVVEMGPAYAGQYFYSLEKNTVLSQNSRLAYDLLFECDPAKFHVWLNTAKFMSLVRTTKTDLQAVTIADTAGLDWHFEFGTFDTDSNSFGPWWDTLSPQPSSAGYVYIINLGKNDLGVPLGFVKMKFNHFSGNEYSVSFASVQATGFTTVQVPKDNTRNYRYLSFSAQSVVNNIEPPKTDWDFCFTKYSVIFYDPAYLPYEVTGVLHNPSKVQAYMDSTVNFDSITIADFNTNRLLSRRDAIGYEWKRLESTLGSGLYSVQFHYTYFVKAGDNAFYKLRFFQFDNANPSNGYPTGAHGFPGFEFVPL